MYNADTPRKINSATHPNNDSNSPEILNYKKCQRARQPEFKEQNKNLI